METVNIYDAKTRLSQLVDRAVSGEDVVVSRNGKALVRITRLAQALAEPLRLVTADEVLAKYSDVVMLV